ncbi:radical SAM protein [Bacteroidota bacterium]
MKIDLIQPRHNYAPARSKEEFGHIYLPTSLLTVGSRLLDAGVDVEIHDENLRPRQISSEYVGFNLLGAPYIPEVIRAQKEIGEKTYLVGGQVVSGLSKDQLRRLFGDSTHNGNDDFELSRILGINQAELQTPEQTSLVPAYEKLDDEVMKEYLSREFSLYVSQGCRFACDFCGADKKRTESYRDIDVIKADLDYLVKRAKTVGIDNLSMYMSNLDVFQSPQKLLEFAYAVKDVRSDHPDFEINLRGLAIVSTYLNARDKSRKSIEELVKAGFNTVGFGVDGWTPEVWKKVKKGHNTEDKCLEAIRSVKEDFGITPEILMVFGHVEADKEDSLRLAYEFTLDMVGKYGAVPRPHVAKAFIPGNDGWTSPEYREAVERLIEHPESFQSLDFTALPSTLTHPDEEIRSLATKYFLEICSIEGNTTSHTKPITPDLSPKELEEVKRFNEGRYDR